MFFIVFFLCFLPFIGVASFSASGWVAWHSYPGMEQKKGAPIFQDDGPASHWSFLKSSSVLVESSPNKEELRKNDFWNLQERKDSKLLTPAAGTKSSSRVSERSLRGSWRGRNRVWRRRIEYPGKGGLDLRIQTFLQQSTKARESVAVCEKIENDLDSMEAEVEDLKKPNYEVPGTVPLRRGRVMSLGTMTP